MSDPGSRSVRVRRGPRVGVFLGVGGALGLVAAIVLTIAFPRGGGYSAGEVFGFLGLFGVAVGVLVGGGVAVVLDIVSRRRARTTVAERERVSVPRGER